MKFFLATGLATLALLTSLPAQADDYDCSNYNRAVTIENGTSYNITDVYAVNRDYTTDWSYNLLDYTLAPGERARVSVDDGTGYHVFNVEVDTEDGYIGTTLLNACDPGDSYWYVTDDQLEEGDY